VVVRKLLAAAILLAACGSTPAAPADPSLTIFNSARGQTRVDAPGASHSVECGGEVVVHPTGPLPWRVTVHTAAQATGSVTVTANTSVVYVAEDRRGNLSLSVGAGGGHGPPPGCPRG